MEQPALNGLIQYQRMFKKIFVVVTKIDSISQNNYTLPLKSYGFYLGNLFSENKGNRHVKSYGPSKSEIEN